MRINAEGVEVLVRKSNSQPTLMSNVNYISFQCFVIHLYFQNLITQLLSLC